MRCNKSDVTVQIEREQQRLKSSILKSRNGRNETTIQTLLGTNEKTKITVLVTGIILLIVVAVTLGLLIGLLDPVSIDNQQTTKTLSKACQGNWRLTPYLKLFYHILENLGHSLWKLSFSWSNFETFINDRRIWFWVFFSVGLYYLVISIS